MSKTPKGALTRITDIARAWETLRPEKSFSGLTLEQFKQAVQPSLDARKEIEELDGRSDAAKARRDTADTQSLETAQRVINAVKSDPEEGEDGELYAAMGFVRKSVRSSGLTRRRGKEEPKADTIA